MSKRYLIPKRYKFYGTYPQGINLAKKALYSSGNKTKNEYKLPTIEDLAKLTVNNYMPLDARYGSISVVFYSGHNKLSVIPKCYAVTYVHPKKEYPSGGLIKKLEDYEYFTKKGFHEYNIKDLCLNKPLTEKEALEHPIWHSLLGVYNFIFVDYVFRKLKDKYKQTKGMAIDFLEDYPKQPTIYPLSLCPLCGNGGKASAANLALTELDLDFVTFILAPRQIKKSNDD